jgi:hypothetical protein
MRIVCGNVDSIKCDICTVFVNGLRTLVGRQASEKDIVNFSIEVCEFFKIEDHRVCQGIVRMFKDNRIHTIDDIHIASLYNTTTNITYIFSLLSK